MSETNRLNCRDCESAYEFTADDPPCSGCFPQVHYRNIDILKLHSHVQGQYIMSMAGVVSLDVMAIHKTLDCYGLPYDDDRLDMIDKVQYLSSINIGFRNMATKSKK